MLVDTPKIIVPANTTRLNFQPFRAANKSPETLIAKENRRVPNFSPRAF
jgi:hypothetical protein